MPLDPFLGEVMLVSFNFAPKGWTFCNGQLLQINQNQALFSLLGTTFGGDGRDTFGLPDLRGRVPQSFADFNGGSVLGQQQGAEFHTVTSKELPPHIHTASGDGTTAAASNVAAPAAALLGQSAGKQNPGSEFAVSMYGSGGAAKMLAASAIANAGGSQPHENRQPFLTLNFCIALQGIFPSQT